MAAGIELRGVSHEFGGAGGLRVIEDLSLSIETGAFASLIGPSGCGKSTLLRILAGLIRPSGGEALIGDTSAILHTGLAAYMPQRDLLLPWRRAIDNATLGAEVAGLDRSAARRSALALFERFGLAGFERAWPSQMSGGMRQRLALLRTFLLPSGVLLLDEPFGALDAITRRSMQRWLQGVWSADRRTVFFVTHDVEEALVLSDAVYVMTPRPGRIELRLDVDLPRPREPSIVTDPEFLRLKAVVLEALEPAFSATPLPAPYP